MCVFPNAARIDVEWLYRPPQLHRAYTRYMGSQMCPLKDYVRHAQGVNGLFYQCQCTVDLLTGNGPENPVLSKTGINGRSFLIIPVLTSKDNGLHRSLIGLLIVLRL